MSDEWAALQDNTAEMWMSYWEGVFADASREGRLNRKAEREARALEYRRTKPRKRYEDL